MLNQSIEYDDIFDDSINFGDENNLIPLNVFALNQPVDASTTKVDYKLPKSRNNKPTSEIYNEGVAIGALPSRRYLQEVRESESSEEGIARLLKDACILPEDLSAGISFDPNTVKQLGNINREVAKNDRVPKKKVKTKPTVNDKTSNSSKKNSPKDHKTEVTQKYDEKLKDKQFYTPQEIYLMAEAKNLKK